MLQYEGICLGPTKVGFCFCKTASTSLPMQIHSPWHSPRGFMSSCRSSSNMRVCRQEHDQVPAVVGGLLLYGQKLNIPSGHTPSAPEGQTRVKPASHSINFTGFRAAINNVTINLKHIATYSYLLW